LAGRGSGPATGTIPFRFGIELALVLGLVAAEESCGGASIEMCGGVSLVEARPVTTSLAALEPVHDRRHQHGGAHEDCVQERRRLARPRPSSLIDRPSPSTKPANTIMIMIAGGVMMPPVLGLPDRDGPVVVRVCTHSSCIRLTRNTW
jgi:hypothetical protein